ncbi:hypothetical protein [Brevundimonas naejangsanensis]|uniref:hypothetical protein n=1 Tax=Brevundimonas naejangsanensis TaxID=588932 RepID=UPI0039F70011
MTPAEFKGQEGSRIQALHGALGSLPALALVFASDISQVKPGAPLFAAAVILVIGAYVHWNSTDTVFWITNRQWIVPDDSGIPKADALLAKISALGHQHVALNYAYAIATLGCSIAGFAAVYSDLRLGISTEAGFIVVGFVLLAVAIEVVSSRLRFEWIMRKASELGVTLGERA